jgi:hypothetical protein
MLYALIYYNREDVVWSWSQAQTDAVMQKLQAIQDHLKAEGRMGPILSLLPTTTATTLRTSKESPLVIDGPFAETMEQLLGVYVIDVAGLDAALEVAHNLGEANPGAAYEIRPIALYTSDSWLGS